MVKRRFTAWRKIWWKVIVAYINKVNISEVLDKAAILKNLGCVEYINSKRALSASSEADNEAEKLIIKVLKNQNKLVRHGSDRAGFWEVNE